MSESKSIRYDETRGELVDRPYNCARRKAGPMSGRGPWSYCLPVLAVAALALLITGSAFGAKERTSGAGPTEFSSFEFIGGASTTGTGVDALLGRFWTIYVTIADEAAFEAWCIVQIPCASLDGETIEAEGGFALNAAGQNVIFVKVASVLH